MRRREVLLLWLIVLPCFVARPQQFETPAQYEITSLSIEGNDALTDPELSAQLMTRETPGMFNKLLHSINDDWGRENVYFDETILGEDLDRLRQLYHDHGFYDVRIDTVLRFREDKRTIGILLKIREGYRAVMDTIAFKGLTSVPDFVHEEIRSSPAIKVGDPFNRMLLEEEIGRVRMILWNAGYANAAFVQDSSWLARYASTRNCVAVVSYRLGKRYRFGGIHVRQDEESGRPDITDEIVLQQLDYDPGDFYSHARRVSSERNLNRIGIFDQSRIAVEIPADEDTSLTVTSRIAVRPRDRHELAPELIFSDENNTFNLGTGIGYSHRNFFGGARIFSTRIRFRTQTIGQFPDYFDPNTESVANIDLTLELQQPYIFSNRVKGTWSFSLILDKQKPYRQEIIRNKFGITNRLAEFTTGYLDWTLERVALKKNINIPDSSDVPEIQRQINQLREAAKAAQFNSILSFTIQRDKSNDIFSPSAGFIHTATIEEAGLLPVLLKKIQPDLPFTQFYRVQLLGRWYFDMTRRRFSILGIKLKGGFEEKYGESRRDPNRGIPQAHRFYAGGGGSVRGWQSRSLSATGNPQLGGNLAFEGSTEARVNIFQSLRDGYFDKIWLVGFVDFGNIWGEVGDFELRDIAVAGGFGFRYDTIFGPFRVDFGMRVYDPAGRPGNKWITQRKFFGETFSQGVVHFGIGHAF